MRNLAHYRTMFQQNPDATVGANLAASAVYAATYGVCEAEHHTTEEWRQIARSIRAQHGSTLSASDAMELLNQAAAKAAAQTLGAAGGRAGTGAAKRRGSVAHYKGLAAKAAAARKRNREGADE